MARLSALSMRPSRSATLAPQASASSRTYSFPHWRSQAGPLPQVLAGRLDVVGDEFGDAQAGERQGTHLGPHDLGPGLLERYSGGLQRLVHVPPQPGAVERRGRRGGAKRNRLAPGSEEASS